MRKWTATAALACVLICAPLALAASSPTVSAGATTSIGDTSATLHGTVDPNALATTYQFAWGPTSALGTLSPATAASAGSGTAAVAESTKLSGLSPDTTYYYELVASNSAGTSTTPVETFKTSGNPAPAVTTDPAIGIGRYAATLAGAINPNNQATTYWFEYGLTDAYGLQTAVKSLPAGTAPVSVSVVLPGIAPGTAFHYRLVASHGSTSTSYGADQTFETLPWPRPRTALSVAVTPKTDSHAPYLFTTRGRIRLPDSTTDALACHGTVTVRYYVGARRLASRNASISSTCTYSETTRIVRLPAGVHDSSGKAKVSVLVRYGGDTYLAPTNWLRTAVAVG